MTNYELAIREVFMDGQSWTEGPFDYQTAMKRRFELWDSAPDCYMIEMLPVVDSSEAGR